MTIVVAVAAGILALAGTFAVIRMSLGPTILDRIITLDVITAILVGGLASEAVLNQHSTTLPILVVVALVGFIGSTSVARFAPGRKRESER